MKQFRLALLVSAVSISIAANANPDILKKFKEVYNKPNADCVVCHSKPPQRNPYGKAVEGALYKAGVQEATAEVFKSIETLDSDGDGISNGDEIKGDSKPGDPASKPAAAATTAPKPESASSDLIPKNSFHPALVHFPIALLAIAALFELISLRKDSEFFHKASVLNLTIGLVSAAGAIITGVVAWLRIGYQIEGYLLFHLILASSSVLVGVIAYTQRDKKEAHTYLGMVLLSGLLVLIAGHFGGAVMGI